MTDVRNFGFFVDVPALGMSGLVPVSGLSDDFYIFDAERGQLVGRRTGRIFKLGDRLEVQVAKVDTFKRQVDFGLPQSPALKLSPGFERGGQQSVNLRDFPVSFRSDGIKEIKRGWVELPI